MYYSVADLGERSGGPAPLFIDQIEAWRAEKKFLATYLDGIRQTGVQ